MDPHSVQHPGAEYFNCVALSTTSDPTGRYYRYAFSTGTKFPDYPKYGVWPDAYYISTREFGRFRFSGVGAYAVDRARMLAGDPNAGMVMFNVPPRDKPWLPGEGFLPSDLDGSNLPPRGSPNVFVGTQDDEGPYGAPYDAINMWQFPVQWRPAVQASFVRSAQLRTREFAFRAGRTAGRASSSPRSIGRSTSCPIGNGRRGERRTGTSAATNGL